VGHVVAELLFDVGYLVTAITLMEMWLFILRPVFLEGEVFGACLKFSGGHYWLPCPEDHLTELTLAGLNA
jgi:hypothetical protein